MQPKSRWQRRGQETTSALLFGGDVNEHSAATFDSPTLTAASGGAGALGSDDDDELQPLGAPSTMASSASGGAGHEPSAKGAAMRGGVVGAATPEEAGVSLENKALREQVGSKVFDGSTVRLA